MAYDELKALGAGSTAYRYDRPAPELLERFPSPFEGYVDTAIVRVVAPEFTSLCPKTGQPDFATIAVEYLPEDWCVESKSFKLYLGSFRQHGEFHEACVNRILNDLVHLLQPVYIKVTGQFTPRGGISFWPTAEYDSRKELKDADRP